MTLHLRTWGELACPTQPKVNVVRWSAAGVSEFRLALRPSGTQTLTNPLTLLFQSTPFLATHLRWQRIAVDASIICQ